MGTGEKKSLADRIHDLIYEEVPDKQTQQSSDTGGGTAESAATDAPPMMTPEKTAKVNDATYKLLINAIEGTGSAYAQFADMMNSLSDAGVTNDEAKLYAAAFTAVGKQGLTFDQIVRALDTRLNALDEENKKFVNTMDGKTAGIKKTLAEVKEREDNVASLKKKIEDLMRQNNEAQQSIAAEKAKMEDIQAKFNAALERVKSEVQETKSRFIKYLKKGGK